MNSRDYWAVRSAQDMVDRMGTAEQTAAEMNKAIQQSADYIAKEVKAVFRGMESFGISESEARKILNAAGNKTALQDLRAAAQRVSDPDKRQALLSAIDSAGAYRYRITRLEQLNKDINRECRKLYHTENRAVTSALKNVANDSYYHAMYNIQQEAGLGFSFAKFSQRDVDRILRANWLGGNYSQRIWRDVSATAESMKKELLVSMLSGRSNEKTARIIQDRFGVNAYCARRIVRTESAYVANTAQMSAYDEAGVEKYRFIATLDSKTSEVCAALDGKVFAAKGAKPGTNYPPMHPFCRSTTIAEFGEDTLAGMERRARDKDGNVVKVPADMGYEEWYRRFVENGVDKSAKSGIMKSDDKDDIAVFLEQRNQLEVEEKKLKQLEAEADELFFKYDATFDEDDPVKQAEYEKIFRAKEEEVESQNALIEKIKKALSPLEEKAVELLEVRISKDSGIPRQRVSLKGMQFDMAKEISDSVKTTVKQYPELKGHLSSLHMGVLSDKYAYAGCAPLSGELICGERMKNTARVRELYLENVMSKLHPAGTDSSAIMVHEMGHALDGYMTKMGMLGGKIHYSSQFTDITRSSEYVRQYVLEKLGWYDKVKSIRAELLSQKITGRAYGEAINKSLKEFITNEISEYAADSEKEFFAELFAEHVMSSNPRRAARIFGELIDTTLGR